MDEDDTERLVFEKLIRTEKIVIRYFILSVLWSIWRKLDRQYAQRCFHKHRDKTRLPDGQAFKKYTLQLILTFDINVPLVEESDSEHKTYIRKLIAL